METQEATPPPDSQKAPSRTPEGSPRDIVAAHEVKLQTHLESKAVVSATVGPSSRAPPKDSPENRDAELKSAISKLMAFLKKDRKNSQSLSMIFVTHDRAEKAKTEKNRVPFDDGGIRLKQLVVEFNKLGVGFVKKEVLYPMFLVA